MKVLVVDDAAIIRLTMRMILQKNGHEVFDAADLSSGLALLFKQKPDFVFTDLHLAGDSGLELFSEICTLYPSVPVVLMTASTDEKIHKEALASGMREVISKPISPDKILSLISTHSPQIENSPRRVSVTLETRVFDAAVARAKLANSTLEDILNKILATHLKPQPLSPGGRGPTRTK